MVCNALSYLSIQVIHICSCLLEAYTRTFMVQVYNVCRVGSVLEEVWFSKV